MATWHCERAWLGGEDLAEGVTIEEEAGTVVAVEVDTQPPSGAEHLAGIVLPGFANAHSHAFHRALRGRGERDRGSFWSWREEMYDLAARLTPSSLAALAEAAFAEMLCAGYTAVGEFHYLHFDADGRPGDPPHAMERAVVSAAANAGVRLTLLDACYLESSPGRPPEGVQRRFADASAAAWAARVEALSGALGDDVVLGAAVHSVRAVPPPAIEAVASWAASHGAPLHAHVSEQPAEDEASLAAYGATPATLLARAGAVSPRFCAVHATHCTTEDRALLGGHGATACVCPTTERHLGDGLVELGALLDVGVEVCVGSDSQAVVDPFEELRCLEGHERLRTGARGAVSPGRRLAAASVVGHRALGRPRGGALRPGAPCDLVRVDPGSTRLAGTGADPVAGLVAAATAADVRDVVVGGRLLVADGRHASIDVPAALERAIAAAWS